MVWLVGLVGWLVGCREKDRVERNERTLRMVLGVVGKFVGVDGGVDDGDGWGKRVERWESD